MMASPIALRATGLSKAYGAVVAVHNVSFDLHQGEMLAMIGPNGAGKTTCFNLINGQIKPDQGQVLIHQSPTLGQTNWTALGQRVDQNFFVGIGRTFQIASVFHSMTVRENVQMVLLSAKKGLNDFWRIARQTETEQANQLLEQVQLLDQAERAASEMAYSDLKRLELAMALANQPKVLLMDEPTAGMPPRERQDLMARVKAIAQSTGLAVLFTEHSMDTVFTYADRVMVLARGELIAVGTVDAVRNDPQVKAVYLGDEAENTTEVKP